MELSERVENVLKCLDERYGPMRCYLDHENTWQLLIAVILSAQCTDARVNIITKDLFKKYKTLEDFANADLEDMEKAIKSAGFYHNKAKNIISCCKKIINDFNGVVPQTIEELTSLAGVGRKTANVIRGNVYNIPSIVVDTHVRRISNLLEFTNSTDPVKIEFELMKILPKDHWISYNTQIIAHGRKVCIARRPKCDICILAEYCPSSKL